MLLLGSWHEQVHGLVDLDDVSRELTWRGAGQAASWSSGAGCSESTSCDSRCRGWPSMSRLSRPRAALLYAFFSLLLREDVDSLVRGQPAALKHCRRNLWLRAWVDSCMLNERGPEEWFQVLELRICCCWLNDREHIVWFKVLELRISCFSMKDRGPEVRFWALESRICCCSKIGESWLSCEAHTQFQERGAVQVYRAGGSRGFCPEVAFIKAEGVNKWDYGALQLEWVKLWLNGINWGQRHRARVMLRSWSLQVAPNRSVR